MPVELDPAAKPAEYAHPERLVATGWLAERLESTHLPDYPDEGGLRGGHIPGARSVPWARAAAPDGSFRPRAELAAIFVLTHLLGFSSVRNYDGSWTEWGNAVRVPIVRGDRPGDPGPARSGGRG